MKTLRMSAIGLVAALASSVPLTAFGLELIQNGGFESGFTGWTRADEIGSDGTFLLQNGAASPLNGFPVPAPPQGTTAAMSDAQGGGSHLLYQDFVLAALAPSATLSFRVFVNNGADAFRTPATLSWLTPTLNQQARVDLLPAAVDPFSVAPGDVLLNAFRTLVGDPLTSGYTLYSLDVTALLNAHVGESLRLRFAEVDNVNFMNLGVDDVRLTVGALAAPEPASWLLAGAALLLMARRRV